MRSVKNEISGWSLWRGMKIDDDVSVMFFFMEIDLKFTENIKMPLLGVLSKIDKGEI